MKTVKLFFVVVLFVAFTAGISRAQDSGTISIETPSIDCIGEGPFLVEGNWSTKYSGDAKGTFKGRFHATITNLVTGEVYYYDRIMNQEWKWVWGQGAGFHTVFNQTLTDSNGNVLASGQTHEKFERNANGDPSVYFFNFVPIPCAIPPFN